jgi:hypothetical protein
MLTRTPRPIQWLFLATTALTVACGGGGEADPAYRGVEPAPVVAQPREPLPPPLPGPDDRQHMNALALLEAVSVAGALSGGAIQFLSVKPSSGHCVFLSGSYRLDVDGVPQTSLLTGNHSFAAEFNECLMDGLVGTQLNGTVAGSYAGLKPNGSYTQTTIVSMRGTQLSFYSDLYAVTGVGSVTSSYLLTDIGLTTMVTPSVGFALTNHETGNVAIFEGGDYRSAYDWSTQAGHWSLNDLRLVVAGNRYTVDGRLHWRVAPGGGGLLFGLGDVRVSRDGALHARLYGDANGNLRSEILVPLVRF